jgi:methylated-DNA-[protein]-cysteine S-methyltransferase
MHASIRQDYALTFFIKSMPSPVGLLQLIASAQGLAAVLWENEDGSRVRLGPFVENAAHPVLIETERQLTRYFDGKLQQFSLPLDFHGTAFQKSVWQALLDIPWGETRSYAQIARQLGRPTASRAVGAANGRNPISIIAPCHRVLGSDGKLTGFAGGLAAKAHLLALEGVAGTNATLPI